MNVATLLLGALAVGARATVITDAGYCPDVSSVACAVREYWPRALRAQSVGVEAYWFANSARPPQVCFVTLETYRRYSIGQDAPQAECLWRERRP